MILFYLHSGNRSHAAEDKKIMSESVTSPNYIELCADIVSAYVSNNSVPTHRPTVLLNSVYAALTKTAQGQQEEPEG